jgi:alkaline phosphatase D
MEATASRPVLTHGPIVGATTEHSVAIWARAQQAAEMQVRLGTQPDLSDGVTISGAVALTAEHDFTGVAELHDLQPDTFYWYTVLLNDQPAAPVHEAPFPSFRTFPRDHVAPERFSFAFGSCFIPQEYGDEVFACLGSEAQAGNLSFFLMVGDNVYVDEYIRKIRPRRNLPAARTLLELYREAYRDTWSAPSRGTPNHFREFLMRTPSFMIFDDHEFWDNWGNSPAHYHDTEGFSAAQQAYREYQDSHNPGFQHRHSGADPEYYYTFSFADVGFFVLDCRTRRNCQATPFPTMLGGKQRTALYDWLLANNDRYRVKFIISSVPICFTALPHWLVNLWHDRLGDQWLGYREERAELFHFFQSHRITGVHFLSGDIHLGQGVQIRPRTSKDAPVVYSYTSSPLANTFWLLPPEAPPWASALVGAILGAVLGAAVGASVERAQSAGLSGNQQCIASLLGAVVGAVPGAGLGAVAGELVRRVIAALTPKTDRVRPGPLGRLLYWLARHLVQGYYFRQITGVSRDQIKGESVEYAAHSLFPFAPQVNVGMVHVQRARSRARVQFELYDASGKLIRQEEPHEV